MKLETTLQAASEKARKHRIERMVVFDSEGNELQLSEVNRRFEAACKKGGIDLAATQKGKMWSSAPPGWKKTTKALKKHVGEKNAFRLAWWMSKRGYKPHK